MKTSNLLLLVFFILTLVIPLGLFLSLRTKIGGTDFKENHFSTDNFPRVRRPLPRWTTLKIKNSFPNMLKCHLIPGDSSYYAAYANGEELKDLHFFHSSDTLSISFREHGPTAGRQEDRNGKELLMDLHVSSWQRLEIDGAMVHIDSGWNADAANVVVLKNGGQIRIADGFAGKLTVLSGGGEKKAMPLHPASDNPDE